MSLIATAEAAHTNRQRAVAGDGMGFWHTLYLGRTRYNMAPGEADPPTSTLFPMAFLVEQDPGDIAHALDDAAQRLGFKVGKATIEAEGQCAACAAARLEMHA
jgi:hypothetical protein